MVIYVFGDSNSAPQWAPGRPWVRRLADRLVGESAGNDAVKNYAIGGQRMFNEAAVPGKSYESIDTYALKILDGCVSLDPAKDCVLLGGPGTNDFGAPGVGNPPWGLMGSYVTLRDQIKSRYGLTTFAMPVLPMRPYGPLPPAAGGILPADTWNAREWQRVWVNQHLANNFAEQGHYFAGHLAALEYGTDQQKKMYDRYMHDALHINDIGHVVVADSIPLAKLRPFV